MCHITYLVGAAVSRCILLRMCQVIAFIICVPHLVPQTHTVIHAVYPTALLHVSQGCSSSVPGQTTSMCEVVPGSCPAGAAPAQPAAGTSDPVYDTCGPLITLARCKCAGSWGTAAGQSYRGACAPPDSAHPEGSWCQVCLFFVPWLCVMHCVC